MYVFACAPVFLCFLQLSVQLMVTFDATGKTGPVELLLNGRASFSNIVKQNKSWHKLLSVKDL